LYFPRFDFFGIYVVMFLEILKTLVQVIVVFSILIVAFGLSFYILLCSKVRGSQWDGYPLQVVPSFEITCHLQGEYNNVLTFLQTACYLHQL
jgi:hypothetical protein